MAPETIRKGIYSEQSDVWAWGVTAHETFNRGAIPYGKKKPTIEVVRQILNDGLRLEFPEDLSADLESLFEQCFATEASERPSFREIINVFNSSADEVIYADLSTFAANDADRTTNGQVFSLAAFRA